MLRDGRSCTVKLDQHLHYVWIEGKCRQEGHKMKQQKSKVTFPLVRMEKEGGASNNVEMGNF